MLNSHLNHYASSLGSGDVDFQDIKIQQLNYTQADVKPQRLSNTKTINSTPGSTSNSNSSSNGVYVDMGKVLLEAAKSGDSEKVQECVKNGAPFITDWLGTSALHIAAKNNFYDTCATLLRSGISKDAKTKVDRTPLHFAVFEGNFEICQLLIQHECSMDPLDMLKMTPLHWAIDRGFDNIAELLLEHGANPYIVSKFLKTPFSIAKEKNNDFIANLIEMLPNAEMKPVIAPSSSTQEINFIKTSQKREEAEKSQKRERIHSYDAPDVKRTKASLNDAKSLTLQLLKEQMSMMTSSAEDNMIQSAIQSGRKIMLTEAGKRLLNDSNLNKFLKIPLNTTISSSTAGTAAKRSSVSPRSATVTSRRTSDSSDILEIFRDNVAAAASGSGVKKMKPDILNIIRSSSELQEVTMTQRTKSSPLPSPTQKSSISLSAINVPKHKVPPKQQSGQQKTQLPSSPDANNLTDFRTDTDFTQPDVNGRQFSELSTNYQQLKRSFEREQQKTAALQRQLKQLEVSFDVFKRQQSEKFDSILKLLTGNNRRISEDDDDTSLLEEVEEIL